MFPVRFVSNHLDSVCFTLWTFLTCLPVETTFPWLPTDCDHASDLFAVLNSPSFPCFLSTDWQAGPCSVATPSTWQPLPASTEALTPSSCTYYRAACAYFMRSRLIATQYLPLISIRSTARAVAMTVNLNHYLDYFISVSTFGPWTCRCWCSVLYSTRAPCCYYFWCATSSLLRSPCPDVRLS